MGGGHDEREQTLNALLVEMDGFEGNEGVIVIAATNRPDVLDPALLRPGRFDRQVVVGLPDIIGREQILKVHMKKVPLDEGVEPQLIARGTPGFSGADLANLVNEAALLAARRQSEEVSSQDFTGAHDRIVMGSERRDLLNPGERRRTAIHESGHAIAALMSPEADPVHQVTIIPRGRALGVTEQLPVEDRYNYTEGYLSTRLTVLMGGRCAEQLVLGEISSGAGSDLEQATRLARMMVAQWGMSESLGPVHFSLGDEHPFLGYELTRPRDYSEASARQIDEEVKRMVADAERRCAELLATHSDSLDRLVEALLEKETLDRQAIDRLLAIQTGETDEVAQ
jgi:cell division protease FtsH